MTLPIPHHPTVVPFWILLIMASALSFGITRFIIPSVVTISKLKNLCNSPNGRTSHEGSVPTLGGIAVFIGLIISTVIFTGSGFTNELKYIISGLVIVFFVGIKDDILVIDPVKKLTGQVIAALLISIFADIRITGLYGLFGIGTIPYLASIVLTVFVFIAVTNGFNLIDGIDGLASGIGILTASVFGTWFWLSGDLAFTVLSFSLAGALSAFFRFNVFSTQNKIFLGDTGSLVTGFTMSAVVCRFLQSGSGGAGATVISMNSAPAVAFGVLIVPLFDSLRVFVLRFLQGKSPFEADRQHLHHGLLKLGFTHLQSTLILVSVNALFVILSWAMRNAGVISLTLVILATASALTFVLYALVRKAGQPVIPAVFYRFTGLKISGERVKA